MKRYKLLCAFVGLGLTCCLSGIAQEKGSWRATSTTARGITGDLIFSNEKITINFAGFTIAPIRALQPAEAGATFDLESTTGGAGNLYRTSIPADKKFLHHNTLCGSDETAWVVTYVMGRTLQVAFFSGAKMPVLTHEAIADSTSLCGTFSYSR